MALHFKPSISQLKVYTLRKMSTIIIGYKATDASAAAFLRLI